MHISFKNFLNYIKFLKFYLFATFFALITDLLTYSYLRNYFEIIFSAIISFISSQIILFSILSLFQRRKIKRKRYAFPVQILIGIGTGRIAWIYSFASINYLFVNLPSIQKTSKKIIYFSYLIVLCLFYLFKSYVRIKAGALQI